MSIKKAYNSWADQYDTNENKTRDLDQKATINTLTKHEFSTVLELGCGTGKNTVFLLEKANAIIGMDFSQEMLNKAKERVNDNRVKFLKADLTENWNIEDDYADLVTCSLTLEHIKGLDSIFEQVYKKLKSNGIFFISELHPFKQYSGSKAKFESENKINELETYIHHVSEYLLCAKKSGFEMIELKEWFDNMSENEIPRLISFVFRK